MAFPWSALWQSRQYFRRDRSDKGQTSMLETKMDGRHFIWPQLEGTPESSRSTPVHHGSSHFPKHMPSFSWLTGLVSTLPMTTDRRRFTRQRVMDIPTSQRRILHHRLSSLSSHRRPQVLLRYGARVNVKTEERWTPLHLAVSTGNVEIIKVHTVCIHSCPSNEVNRDFCVTMPRSTSRQTINGRHSTKLRVLEILRSST